ncbi:MAG TPA: serine/threonine-protein kinase, partial [Polyangiaceae bacterium]|nr:serine/threonine-protein kinase [Polyangiaceae bacterium]
MTIWQHGEIIAGRYRLEDHLGSGAAAEVWSAFDSNLHATVAVKLLDPGFAGSTVATRFLREARAAAQIRSLHVVQILDHGEHRGTAYIAMELLEGETLADRLDRVIRLPHPKVTRVIGDIAKAATKAHDAGIIHRDLKPANVFLIHGEDDDDEVAKVFDFGIAKVEPLEGGGRTGATKSGTLLGTPAYMSPEQATGAKVDYRTDLYAIGILA